MSGRFVLGWPPSRDRRAAILASLKLLWDVSSGSEVHRAGRLTAKRGMWKMSVVLINVEGDQLPGGCNRVERVQVHPLVLEQSPPDLVST